ncbi:MAG TPA: AmmeMemoRadiSam system radical SAM enzyme [Bacteroidales bacterium]|nr:AmmeMemoRadiSam system radical SAM enzyme [Bacteroidales bacterium]
MTRRDFLQHSICGTCGITLMGKSLGAFATPFSVIGDEGHEAMYYLSTPRGIKCKLCPHACTIEPGKRGDCRVRENRNGCLITLAWSNPCSIHVDPIEKKPLYHFLPATQAYSLAIAGCNFTCLNCQNWEISQTSPDKTHNYSLTPEEVVKQARAQKCVSIAYTYSEPISYYEYTLETSRLARKAGIKNLLISNGYINPAPLDELCNYIDAANIDLKAFDDDTYTMLTNGTLQPVLDTLIKLKQKGVWLEITNLVVPQWTDDEKMIDKMCLWLASNGFKDTPLHFSRFYPQYKLNRLPPTPVSILERAQKIAQNHGLQYVYIGNVPGAEQSKTFCPKCKTCLVERIGFSVKSMVIKNGRCPHCGAIIPGRWTA